LQPRGQFVVPGGEVEDRVDLFPQEIIQTGDDDAVQIFGDFLGRIDTLGAHEAVYQQDGLEDADVEHPEGPEADQPQFAVPEGHRVPSSPGEVGKYLHVGEIDLRPQGAGHRPGDAEDLGEDGDVGRSQGVASRPEGVVGLAFVKENGGLALPDRELCPPFDFAGASFGNSVNQLFARFVEPFDDLEKNDIVRSHGEHLFPVGMVKAVSVLSASESDAHAIFFIRRRALTVKDKARADKTQ